MGKGLDGFLLPVIRDKGHGLGDAYPFKEVLEIHR
jgi:hypothetical protein